MKLLHLFLAGLLAVQALPTPGTAQDDSCPPAGYLILDGLNGPQREFRRWAEISGLSRDGRRLVERAGVPVAGICAGSPWQERLADRFPGDRVVRLLPVTTTSIVNTGYPVDMNNGALWAGRGFSTVATAGAGFRWGILSAAFAPVVTYQQNRALVESPYGLGSIDWPDRIGTTSFSSIEPGQSFVRVDVYGVAVGFSTENVWWGPGQRNSLLMSNTAPGFPHIFLGTSSPIDVGIGEIELEWISGRLSESPFFNETTADDLRSLVITTASFSPSGLSGLQLGAAYVTQAILGAEAGWVDYLRFNKISLFRSADEAVSTGDDDKAGVFARWVLPASGFEIYAEWAREDFANDFHDFITELDHGRAWNAGLQKIVENGSDWIRLYAEITNINTPLSEFHRSTGGRFYRHGSVSQGYTHRGQLLGAWVGPGSDAQSLGGDYISDWGRIGAFAERVRRDVGTYYLSNEFRQHRPNRFDVELTAGVRGLYFWRNIAFRAETAYSHRRNRRYLPPDITELEKGYRVDSNWSLEFGAALHPDVQVRLPF